LLRIAGFLALNIVVGYLTVQIPGWIPGFFLLLISFITTSLILGLIKPSQLISVIHDDQE